MNLILVQTDISYRSSYVSPSQPLSSGTIFIEFILIFYHLFLFFVIACTAKLLLNKILEKRYTFLIPILSTLIPFLFFFALYVRNGAIGLDINRLNIANIIILF